MQINKENLIQVIRDAWLPLPKSVIPPTREYPLWKELPQPMKNIEPPYDELFIKLLNNSVKQCITTETKTIGVWFSGGIDSTTLLYFLKMIPNIKIIPYVIDFGCYPDEIERAKIASQSLDIRIKIIKMIIDDHLNLLRESILNLRSPTDFATQVLLATKLAEKDSCDIILSALGLDECQAGYPSHITAKDDEFQAKEAEIFEICQAYHVWQNIAQSKKIKVMFPFLNLDLISLCRALPRSQKNIGNQTKILLRKVMKEKIPDLILNAGLTAGTKRGFGPLFIEWWNAGLRNWALDQIKLVPNKYKQPFIRDLFLNKVKRGTQQRLLRLASVPIFIDLFDNGFFN